MTGKSKHIMVDINKLKTEICGLMFLFTILKGKAIKLSNTT